VGDRYCARSASLPASSQVLARCPTGDPSVWRHARHVPAAKIRPYGGSQYNYGIAGTSATRSAALESTEVPCEPGEKRGPRLFGGGLVIVAVPVIHEGMAGGVDEHLVSLALLLEELRDVLALLGGDAGILLAPDNERRRAHAGDILGAGMVVSGVEGRNRRKLAVLQLGDAPDEQTAHAEADDTHLLGQHIVALLQIIDARADIRNRGVAVERHRRLHRLVWLGGHVAVEKVRGEDDIAFTRETLGQLLDVRLDAPPLLDQDDAGVGLSVV